MGLSNKKILVTLSLALVLAIALFSLGIAYAGGIRGVGLLGVWFFVTFGIVVVLAQVIPAGIVLASVVSAISSGFRKNEEPVAAT